MLKRLLIFSFLIFSLFAEAQKNIAHKKGTMFAFWGWHRAVFSRSTIHFKGNDYDFKLHAVKASDKPIDFNYNDYLRPDRVTIPQTNYKIGYFIKDNLAISLGVDHMKYVMDQNQYVKATGEINRPGYENVIQNGEAYLSEDFVQFEHTDGLNYFNAELEYYYNLAKFGFLKINALGGGGAGILFPKTNSTLMDQERYDKFRIAGWGLSIKLGVELLFWDLFFLRSEGKEGYINMPNIRTTSHSSDKASQEFLFAQWNYTFGFSWRF